MLRLFLLRHAKAERLAPSGGGDHERLLAARGRSDAEQLGRYLAAQGLVPDAALVSTAARTRETWELLSGAFDRAPAASFEHDLYNADPEAILALIHATPGGAQSLMVVGHNPGMHGLAHAVAGSGDRTLRGALGADFPTSALAILTLDATRWDEWQPSAGRLTHFLTPALLATLSD